MTLYMIFMGSLVSIKCRVLCCIGLRNLEIFYLFLVHLKNFKMCVHIVAKQNWVLIIIFLELTAIENINLWDLL